MVQTTRSSTRRAGACNPLFAHVQKGALVALLADLVCVVVAAHTKQTVRRHLQQGVRSDSGGEKLRAVSLK